MARPRKKVDIVETQDEELFNDETPRVLNLTKPLCTRKNSLKFIAKTDGKLLFQALGSGSILITDLYGTIGGKQRVYNGTPADFRVHPKKDFLPGDAVFVVRLMSSGRKVFSGRVVSVEPNRNVVVELNESELFKASRRRTYGDTGYNIFPPKMVFKTPKEIETYAQDLLRDLQLAITDHKRTLETQEKLKNF